MLANFYLPERGWFYYILNYYKFCDKRTGRIIMEKQLVIKTIEELNQYKEQIKTNADLSIMKLKKLLETNDSFNILHQLKFEKSGYEPLFGYELNLIEQLNQMFTYIVSLKGVELLLKEHPGEEFVVNFGTQNGYDIMTLDGKIICECFASTNPLSNRKIIKDLERLQDNKNAEYKYEFFYSLEANATTLDNLYKKYPTIKIIRFEDVEL